MRDKREKSVRLHSGFPLPFKDKDRSDGSNRVSGDRGREGIQDGHIQAEEKASGGALSRHGNRRNIGFSVSNNDVARAVARRANVSVEDLLGHSRLSTLTGWRQLAYLLAHQLTGQSTTAIGEAFNRDHSTIITGKRKAFELLKEEKILEEYLYLVKELDT